MKCPVYLALYGFGLCLSASGLLGTVSAGEALIIGPEKGLVEPGKKAKTTNPLLGTALGKMDAPNPYNGLVPTIVPGGQSLSTKEYKRRRDAADEKANWLLLAPGELQNKDETESTFGVKEKDYSVEGLEKEDTSRDYTFRGVGKARKPTPEMLKQIQLIKKSKDEPEPGPRGENSSPNVFGGSELNLKSLFEPKTEKGFGESGLNDFTLKDLFKSPAPPVNDDAQRQHRESFNNFIQGSSSSLFPGGNDTKGYHSSSLDWTKAPANNNSPLFGGTLPPPVLKPPAAPDQNFGRPALPLNTPVPAAQENRTFGSTFSDPPRRRF